MAQAGICKKYGLTEKEIRLKTKAIRYYKSDRVIDSPRAAVEVLAEELVQLPFEKAMAIYMDNCGHPVCCQTIGSGNVCSAQISIAKIAQMALLCNCFKVILMHNHTSLLTSVKPSSADKVMTEQAEKALKLLDIQLVDHIIVSQNGGHYSFREQGL